MDKPLELIHFEGSQLSVNEDALNFIKSINEEIIVVSIIGKARTGKSFLMNLLLETQKNGFEVDSTIYSCTKGIWLWGNTKENKEKTKKILFIDSEGTSSIDRSTKTYDSKIYSLIVLISSLFLYNTTGNIDETSIGDLALAAHLSNSITANARIDIDSMITELAPKFIWILRDFTLQKVNPETGAEISGKEYLDVCLRKKNVNVKNSSENNMIRDNIMKYFKDRDCITLVRPVEDETQLKDLTKVPFVSLKEEFKKEFTHLKNRVYNETSTKVLNGLNLTGPSLANLIVEFTKAINSGAVPNISFAWDAIMKKEIDSHTEQALNLFKKLTNVLENETNTISLLKNVLEGKHESLQVLDQFYFRNYEAFYNREYLRYFSQKKQELIVNMDRVEVKLKDKTKKNAERSFNQILKQESKQINENFLSNKYELNIIDSAVIDLEKAMTNYTEQVQSKGGSTSLSLAIDFLLGKEIEICDYYKNLLEIDYSNKHNDLLGKLEILKDENKRIDELYQKEQEKNTALEVEYVNLQIQKRTLDNESKAKSDLMSNLEKEYEKSIRSEREINLTPDQFLTKRGPQASLDKKPKIFKNSKSHSIDTISMNNQAPECNCQVCRIF